MSRAAPREAIVTTEPPRPRLLTLAVMLIVTGLTILVGIVAPTWSLMAIRLAILMIGAAFVTLILSSYYWG